MLCQRWTKEGRPNDRSQTKRTDGRTNGRTERVWTNQRSRLTSVNPLDHAARTKCIIYDENKFENKNKMKPKTGPSFE